MSCDTLQFCCAASIKPPCCGYCCTSTGESWVLNVNRTQPCAVAPSSGSVSEASRAIHVVGGSEGQRLRNLGDGQLILSRELRWRQAPGAGGDYERLHAQTCPAHDGRRLAARAAAVGDVR